MIPEDVVEDVDDISKVVNDIDINDYTEGPLDDSIELPTFDWE